MPIPPNAMELLAKRNAEHRSEGRVSRIEGQSGGSSYTIIEAVPDLGLIAIHVPPDTNFMAFDAKEARSLIKALEDALDRLPT